jgi:hypothetical protein
VQVAAVVLDQRLDGLGVLKRNPDFNGTYSAWEPNALDGADESFANRRAFGPRYQPPFITPFGCRSRLSYSTSGWTAIRPSAGAEAQPGFQRHLQRLGAERPRRGRRELRQPARRRRGLPGAVGAVEIRVALQHPEQEVVEDGAHLRRLRSPYWTRTADGRIAVQPLVEYDSRDLHPNGVMKGGWYLGPSGWTAIRPSAVRVQ